MFVKKILLLFVSFFLVLGLVACDDGQEASGETEEETPTETETTENEEVDESDQEGAEETDGSEWDEFKIQENIVGKSDKDFTELTKNKPTKVRNDTTGKWRKTTLTENVNIEEYILSYYNTYMEEEEVHFVINFTNNTTTWINEMGGLIHVEVRERVDKEEHDASTLGSGMVLEKYMIYPDGDIEKVED